jgi:hypothetical protein
MTRKIVLSVLFIHIAAILLMMGDHLFYKHPIPQPIKVQTYVYQKVEKSTAVVKPEVAIKKERSQETKRQAKAQTVIQREQKKERVAPPKREWAIPELLELKGQELNYLDSIALSLRASLILPEYGQVKVRLFLKAPGVIEKLEILESQNERNRLFLEKELREFQFPCFNDFAYRGPGLELTIVFKNDP